PGVPARPEPRLGLRGPPRAPVRRPRGRDGRAEGRADRGRPPAGLRGRALGARPPRHRGAARAGADVKAAVALLLFAASCSKPSEPADAGPTKTFTDSRGKAVAVPWPPKRIVSTVPSLTEMLYDVGAGDQVVG